MSVGGPDSGAHLADFERGDPCQGVGDQLVREWEGRGENVGP